MSNDLSPTAIGSQNDESTSEVWLVLIILDHVSLETPIFVVANTEDIDSVGEIRGVAGQARTFTGIPIDIQLPTADGDNPGRAQIKMDNLDPVIVDTVRQVNSARLITDTQYAGNYIEVRFEVILDSAPDTPELVFDGLKVTDCTYDATTITGKLSYETIATEPIADQITPARFPGLF